MDKRWQTTLVKSLGAIAGLYRGLAVSVLAGLVIAGCSMVNTSEFLDDDGGVGCDNSAGAYFLSKSVIKVQISEERMEKDLRIDSVIVKAVPDVRHAYCVDYRPSPTSVDTVEINRTEDGLLSKITSKSDDKTTEILKTLIQTVFIGISGNPDFASRSSGRRGEFTKFFVGEFDPFDAHDTALVNTTLREKGLCMLLEGSDWIEDFEDVAQYCEDPLGFLEGHKGAHKRIRENAILASEDYRTNASRHVEHNSGVLYRPRTSHNFMVFVRNNSGISAEDAKWKLTYKKVVRMENASPILSIGVDRTFFAERQTTLTFTAGALTDVEIEKGSELEGFVEIPLTIVESIVALPANIIQVRINDTNNRAKIIDAQTKLIALEHQRKENNKTRQGFTNNPAAENNPFFRSTQSRSIASIGSQYGFSDKAGCTNICTRSGEEPTRCESKCTCLVNCQQSQIGPTACKAYCPE